MLLNAEVRADALHAFISGLKKSLFLAQPKDLPSALALTRREEHVRIFINEGYRTASSNY